MRGDDRRPAHGSLRALALVLAAAGCSGCAGTGAVRNETAAASGGDTSASVRANLFPICVGKRFGFIDRSGGVVVPPELGWIDETIGDLVMVWVVLPVPPGEEHPGLPPPARAGFVDGRGRFAVEPIYEDAHAFSGGLAAVEREGKWGYVDGRGKVRIPLQYGNARPFSEGLALVEDDAGQRFIDASGRTVLDLSRIRWRRGGVELPVRTYSPFSAGLVAFDVVVHGENPDVLVGFMDREGRIVAEPTFTYAYSFLGAYATVQVACGGGVGGRCQGIIRRDGTWAVPPTYEFLSYLDDGLVAFSALVGTRHLKGFLNERNEVVIPPRYEHSCLWFREGLCETMTGKRWAYVDRSGAEVLVLPADTEHADEFSEGLATVRTAAGAYYVRRDGTRAFEGVFKDASRFRRGLGAVEFRDGGTGYVDHEGRVVYRQAERCEPLF